MRVFTFASLQSFHSNESSTTTLELDDFAEGSRRSHASNSLPSVDRELVVELDATVCCGRAGQDAAHASDARERRRKSYDHVRRPSDHAMTRDSMFRTGKISVLDAAPTIVHLLGLEVAADPVERVLTELLSPSGGQNFQSSRLRPVAEPRLTGDGIGSLGRLLPPVRRLYDPPPQRSGVTTWRRRAVKRT